MSSSLKKYFFFYVDCSNCFHNLHKYNFSRFFSVGGQKFLKKKEISSSSLEAQYEPKSVESTWYEWWESQNYFKPSKSEKDSFVILLPPPNITGTLHLGHTLTTTIQDVLIRVKKMKGQSTLWIPGVDHAGIATQVAVEKYLCQTLGISKHDLGKKEFLKKTWEWKVDKERKIIKQFRKMGASLDWSRLRFTMDPIHSKTVIDAFIQLYNDGLIHHSEYPVNWSCALMSSISDIEVDWIEVNSRKKLNVPGYEKPVEFGILYKFAYKVCDEEDEIVVSTTRPETMLGDVAIAVHPNDPVYTKFQNKKVWHPFRKVKIPVIFDEFVNQNLGTGAVKITPSHSTIDFEVGLKHNLKSINVIDEKGCINRIGDNEKFFGLKRFDARRIILEELKSLGLFRGYQEHPMKVAICSRSGDVIETILKKQWFLKCQPLAQQAINVVEKGDLKLQPENFIHVWYDWLNKTGDWNLSRQLWWGHQIPMYECKAHGENIWVPASTLTEAKLKASIMLETSLENVTASQDPDVLDTWFSSGLLPLDTTSTIDEATNDKPNISLMVTGHDILFFWVARMVMLGLHLKGKLPFKEVLLHGVICDDKGKKMSKSLGNVIRPEDIVNGRSVEDMQSEIKSKFDEGQLSKKEYQTALNYQRKSFPNGIPECGIDALRFTLCSSDILSGVINFDVTLCHSNRHFCNKIWQAILYFIKIENNFKLACQKNDDFDFKDFDFQPKYMNCFDNWILSRLAAVVDIVESSLDCYKFYRATQAIKLFLVEEFCSFYLESSKLVLKQDSLLPKHKTVIAVFYHCLETTLRLLSPFMPFVSEHLYHGLPQLKGLDKLESVTKTNFPTAEDWNKFRNFGLENDVEKILKLMTVLRGIKITYHLRQDKPSVFVKCSDALARALFKKEIQVISELVRVENIVRVDSFNEPNVIKQLLNEDWTVYVKHNHEKETLLRHLNSTLKNEENLRKNLDILVRKMSEENLEEKTPDERARQDKRISSLEMELKKIEEMKQVCAVRMFEERGTSEYSRILSQGLSKFLLRSVLNL